MSTEHHTPINVDHAFNPVARQAQADLDTYLTNRPYQDAEGNIHNPSTGEVQSDYFDQQRDIQLEAGQNATDDTEMYKDMGMLEVARELAHAEILEDRTKINDLSDALLDKMSEQAGNGQMSAAEASNKLHGGKHDTGVNRPNAIPMETDPEMALFNRVTGYKDTHKTLTLIEMVLRSASQEPEPAPTKPAPAPANDCLNILNPVPITPKPVPKAKPAPTKPAAPVAPATEPKRIVITRQQLAGLIKRPKSRTHRTEPSVPAPAPEAPVNKPKPKTESKPVVKAERTGTVRGTSVVRAVERTLTITHDPEKIDSHYNQHASIISSERVKHAKRVERLEIVRDDQKLDVVLAQRGYEKDNHEARDFLVNTFASGDLYASKYDFIRNLQRAHTLASRHRFPDDVTPQYSRTTGASPERFRQRGQIRDDKGGMTNNRHYEALAASEIAKQYNDPYQRRFKPGNNEVMRVNLDDVPEHAQPTDYFIEGRKGEVYKFDYPSGKDVKRYYFGPAQELGTMIYSELSGGKPNKDGVLNMIAEQYQYLVCARPFDQVNNSLFMNLANAQIKMLGLKGIMHGQLDTNAQRLQPKAFKQHFVDTVNSQQA